MHFFFLNVIIIYNIYLTTQYITVLTALHNSTYANWITVIHIKSNSLQGESSEPCDAIDAKVCTYICNKAPKILFFWIRRAHLHVLTPFLISFGSCFAYLLFLFFILCLLYLRLETSYYHFSCRTPKSRNVWGPSLTGCFSHARLFLKPIKFYTKGKK